MASIRERVSKRGETTYQVLFRRGRKQCSETFATRAAADRFVQMVDLLGAERALAELNGAPTTGRLTVDELADQFFAWKATATTPRTIRDYRRDYANWLQPFLGHLPAEDVTERDVQRVVDHMRSRLDPKSVRDRHMILHSIYRYGSAKSRQIVSHNPCKETDLPAKKTKPPKGVTLPEWEAIYDEARRSDPDAADLLLFIVGTGMRWSEAAALSVRAVEDRPEGVLVNVAAVFRRDEHDRQVLVDDAKTIAGIRTISLPASVAAVVRRRSVGKGVDDLVFTSPTGKPWRQSNFLHRTWAGIIDRAGLERRPTPHWLRHTHVALLIRAGASLAEVQRRVGHKDIGTTVNVYGRMVDDIGSDQLAALDLAIAGPRVVVGSVVAGELVAAAGE